MISKLRQEQGSLLKHFIQNHRNTFGSSHNNTDSQYNTHINMMQQWRRVKAATNRPNTENSTDLYRSTSS